MLDLVEDRDVKWCAWFAALAIVGSDWCVEAGLPNGHLPGVEEQVNMIRLWWSENERAVYLRTRPH